MVISCVDASRKLDLPVRTIYRLMRAGILEGVLDSRGRALGVTSESVARVGGWQ